MYVAMTTTAVTTTAIIIVVVVTVAITTNNIRSDTKNHTTNHRRKCDMTCKIMANKKIMTVKMNYPVWALNISKQIFANGALYASIKPKQIELFYVLRETEKGPQLV